ncbi:MAG TPA: hypothetical protein VNP72_07390 [Longimicrobium sp.]|nr:hypothetical protein [Longimicrobium sp.]
MLVVAYKVTVGSAVLEPGDAAPLLSLLCQAALDVPVNRCRVRVHGGSTLAAAPGDDVSVELGHGDALEKVFTGTVAGVAQGFGSIEVEALGSFSALAAGRLNLLYEKETAGGIVSDVLGRVAATEGTVEAGPKLPSYALDDGRTLWAHLRSLATRCGFDLYADVDDKAQFKAYAAAATHAFAFGAEILGYEHGAAPPEVEGVEVYGESPAGQGQGDDASSWLTKKDVKGTAGKTSGKVVRVADRAARNPNLAGDFAKGLLAPHQGTARGGVRLVGAPAVKLGDAVKLEKLPVAAHNGEGRVTTVRHRLHARLGFVTDVEWERA